MPSVSKMAEPGRPPLVADFNMVAASDNACAVGVSPSGLHPCVLLWMVAFRPARSCWVAISTGGEMTSLDTPVSRSITPMKSPGPDRSIYALAAEQRMPLESFFPIDPDISKMMIVTWPLPLGVTDAAWAGMRAVTAARPSNVAASQMQIETE